MSSAMRSITGQRAATRTTGRSIVAGATKQPRVLITGGNSGIGLISAAKLAAKDYEVVLACRDLAKAEDARRKVQAIVPGSSVSTVRLDLADLSSVSECASQLLDQEAFDVVLNNAGVMATPEMKTKDGFEYQMGINHLGHFALTSLLLPSLIEANKPVRIVNVASDAHYFGRLDFNNLMLERPGTYQPWMAYGNSKLANILFTYELAKRLSVHPSITTNCLMPGVVNTDLGRYMFAGAESSWWGGLVTFAAAAFLKTPEQGAETSVYCASSPEVANVSGKYFSDCRVTPSSSASYDLDTARRLFDISAELTTPRLSAVKKAASAAQKQPMVTST